MRKLLTFLIALGAIVFASQADAATKFWVGGDGAWSNTAHWATSSGGSGSTGVPASGDTVTLDGNGGAGTGLGGGPTITVDQNIAIASLALGTTGGNFIGTLDFNTSGPWNFSAGSFGFSGAGTRQVNMGSGTFTLTATFGTPFDLTTVTGLTFNTNTSTIVFNATATGQRSFVGGGQTHNALTIAGNGGGVFDTRLITAGTTIGTLTVTAPNTVWLQANYTISTALNINGTASNNMVNLWVLETANNTLTISGSASINYAVIGGITFTGGPTAHNSFDAGKNVGITILGPSSGGGNHTVGL